MITRLKLPSLWFSALIALWLTVCINFPAWSWLIAQGVSYSITLCIAFETWALLFICLQILYLPKISKPLLVILFVIAGSMFYAEMKLGVFFSRHMMDNILQTDLAESLRLITPTSILWTLCFGVLPATFLVLIRIEFLPLKKELATRLISVGITLVVMLGVGAIAYKDASSALRTNREVRSLLYPANLYAMMNSAYKKTFSKPLKFEAVGLDTKLSKPDPYKHLTVLIIGETVRASNWGLNDYEKNTTPNLKSRGSDIINFKDVTSCGTQTSVSVPCMFSGLGRSNYSHEKAVSRNNLLDVLYNAGHDVIWLDNDSGCQGVCNRVPNVNVTQKADPEFCSDGQCQDNILLKELDQVIESNRLNQKDLVVVLHTIGSHGPSYYERYPEAYRRFQPDCRSNDFSPCTPGEVTNAYDNTIVYADQFIDRVIQKLERLNDYEAALIYLSDHGESLGEKGLYLHGTPYMLAPAEQTKVPMIFWANRTWKNNEGIDFDCLRKNAENKSYSHDNFYSTVFGTLDLSENSSVYDASKDILASCRIRKKGAPVS